MLNLSFLCGGFWVGVQCLACLTVLTVGSADRDVFEIKSSYSPILASSLTFTYLWNNVWRAWLKSLEHLLLLQRPEVCFPGPTLGSSHLIAPVPGNPTPGSVSVVTAHMIYTQMSRHIHVHINKNIKK